MKINNQKKNETHSSEITIQEVIGSGRKINALEEEILAGNMQPVLAKLRSIGFKGDIETSQNLIWKSILDSYVTIDNSSLLFIAKNATNTSKHQIHIFNHRDSLVQTTFKQHCFKGVCSICTKKLYSCGILVYFDGYDKRRP